VLASLTNLVKLVRFSRKESDDKIYHSQQVEALGKAFDTVTIMPYGLHANVPIDFLGVLLQIGSQEQGRVVLPTANKERIQGLESGELIVFHPQTKSVIHFKNNGDIDITSDNDMSVAAGKIKLDGDVDISGKCTITGDLIQGGKNVGSPHKHAQGNDCAGDAQVNTGGVV